MKTLQEKIAVMQAFADGKPIEFLCTMLPGYSWECTTVPFWNWSMYDYRVKQEPPKPIEIEVWYKRDESAGKSLFLDTHNSPYSATFLLTAGYVKKKFREILDA